MNLMDKAIQRTKILRYCEEHGSITNQNSFSLGINSPTKRISEMREMGYDVQTEWEHNIKDDGTKVRFKRYFIKEPEQRNGVNG